MRRRNGKEGGGRAEGTAEWRGDTKGGGGVEEGGEMGRHRRVGGWNGWAEEGGERVFITGR